MDILGYSLCFNGNVLSVPSRGLRQGDTLSPNLFLLCVEGLSCLIRKSADEGKLKGCSIQVQAPSVTHLIFADDNFFPCKASLEEIYAIKAILHKYEKHSGQAINLKKSGIFFSANIRMDKQQELKNVLGVTNDLGEGRYLGLPSLIGKSRKAVSSFLKDRL